MVLTDTIEQDTCVNIDVPTQNTGKGSQYPDTPVVEISMSDDQMERTDLGREMHFPQDDTSDVRRYNEDQHNTGKAASNHKPQRQGNNHTESYHESRNRTSTDQYKASTSTADPTPYIHSVAKVYAVLPFYDVKCLCSGGQE